MSPRPDVYLAPLRYRALTRWYDAVVDATTCGVEWRSRLVGLAAPHEGQLVLDLDLGCGTGTLAATLARSAPGATILGLDADETALGIAYGKFPKETARLSRGMAQRLPFPDGSLDIVVSSLFFHHLSRDSKRAVLCETHRVLWRGGRLVVADWGHAPFGREFHDPLAHHARSRRLATGLFLVPRASDFTLMMVVIGMVAASAGILSPILTYWISTKAGSAQGWALGRQTAAASLGVTVGSATAGLLFNVATLPGASFVLTAGFAVLGFLLSLGLPRLLAPADKSS